MEVATTNHYDGEVELRRLLNDNLGAMPFGIDPAEATAR